METSLICDIKTVEKKKKEVAFYNVDIPLPSNSGLEKENSRLIPRGTALERAGVENKTSIWLVS